MAKVVVVVEGGNVQDVLSDDASVEVCLIDYDNEPDYEPPESLKLFDRLQIGSVD